MANYWLLKTEPSDYCFTDLVQAGTTVWDGVRNNAACKHMRSMQPGDLALIYHTGSERRIVGIAEVISAPYPDPQTAPEAESSHNRLALPVVDIRAVRPLPQAVPLAAIKAHPFFADFALVRQGRLSVVPVTLAQWEHILHMAGES